ncbi:MAG: plastocyanin/azurin family copper-binding protein [Actinomycetota bacterium]|nr:plastocyanin/azurin family copper-binding protein [Actinomycetota bacterium]
MRRFALLLPAVIGLLLVSAPALAENQSVAVCCAPGQGNTFTPKTVSINVGESVTWNNQAGGFHNVVFDDGSFEQPADPAPSAWTATRTFDTPGEFLYYCEQHGNKGGVGMAGKVIVGGGAPQPGPGGDTTAPTLKSLRVDPATFCNKKSKTCRKRGARIRFSLSEPAKVEFTVLIRKDGNVVKTFSFNGKAGKNSLSFSGKGLPRTRYELHASAIDDAGNRSSPGKANFTIAKKRSS